MDMNHGQIPSAHRDDDIDTINTNGVAHLLKGDLIEFGAVVFRNERPLVDEAVEDVMEGLEGKVILADDIVHLLPVQKRYFLYHRSNVLSQSIWAMNTIFFIHFFGQTEK